MEKVGMVILIAVIGAAILIISLVATSLKKLNSDEVGLQYNTIQKTLGDSVKLEGLHNGPPGFEFIIFPSVFKTIAFNNFQCLNKDGVQIELNVAYQYVARPNKLKEIIQQFRNHKTYENVLKFSGQAAMHEACSQFNTSQFQTERGAFQEKVRLFMKERYNQLEADVTDLQVNNIQRPLQYEKAIKTKEAARENIKVAENERPRKVTQAETKKREAEKQATITIDKAKSDARIIENRAKTEAEGILNAYRKEADTYAQLKTDLSLAEDTFLSYIGVRTLANAKNPVYVGMKSPVDSVKT